MVKLLSFWHAASHWSAFLSGQICLDNFMGATCSLPSSITIHDKTDINHCLSQHNKLETLFFCAQSIEHSIQMIWIGVIRNFIMRTYHLLLVMTSPLSYRFQSIIYMIQLYFNVGVRILFFFEWRRPSHASYILSLSDDILILLDDRCNLSHRQEFYPMPWLHQKILWISIDRQP